MISENEKSVYNTHLAVSRSCRNKPFRLRQDFDNFENHKDYVYVKRISHFLSQFPQIKTRKFFEAPYILYSDTEHFDLKFYSGPSAVKAYTTYMKQLQEESPDSDHHIQFIKDSLRFVGMFCIKNKIPLENYITHSGGITYSWMQHIKDHNVTIYCLFEFPDLFNIVRSTPRDELDLLLGNVLVGLSGYKNKYDTSKQARRIVKEGLKRIKRVVDESINTGR